MYDIYLDLLVNGLIVGIFYALMALGLSLIFGILKIINFAHGEFYMVGAYAYTFLAVSLGVPPILALPFAVLVGGLLGYVTERTLIRPLYATYASWTGERGKHEYAIIITFALSILLVNLADKVFGPYSFFGPGLVPATRIYLGPVVISSERLVASGIAAVVLAAVILFVRLSFWGKVIQAVAQNRFGAELCGADTIRVSQIVLMISGGLAAFTGALLSPVVLAEPTVGLYPAIKSFVVIVLGGMGSMAGAVVGGLILGVFEMFGAVYIAPDYRDSFGLIILILVLLLRPRGLFGERSREV